ncbi:MAG: biotin transport system substrate-specific component [Chloroflexota bacterium]|jgi:biotin transport system substrate-specific component|nr:biotin transport system substrate-specific component [Chloroflexota bacterium]
MTIAIPRLDRSTAADRGLTIADFLVPIRVGERLNARVRDIVLVLTGAVFIYLTSRVLIVVPGTPVPITGQTFGVLLVGGALGFRRGLIAVGLYVLLGVVGLPFFAEGKGGLSVIWGASGGYLVGFIVAGAVVGRLAELGWDRKIGGAIGAMLVGSAIIYAIGLPWLKVVAGLSVEDMVAKGLTPFLIGDALKLVLAAVLFPAAWWVVGRRPDDR